MPWTCPICKWGVEEGRKQAKASLPSEEEIYEIVYKEKNIAKTISKRIKGG